MRVPDEIEPYIGFRVWGVGPADNRLYSLNRRVLWTPLMPFEAHCGNGHDHEVPDKRCSCGVYAASTFNRLFDMGYTQQTGLFAAGPGEVSIAGKVKLWGGYIHGRTGWRAQFAYPALLLIPTSLYKLAKPLSEAYQVPYKIYNTQRKHGKAYKGNIK